MYCGLLGAESFLRLVRAAEATLGTSPWTGFPLREAAMNTRELGALAERVAACFLAMKDHTILATGYRFHGKEIDIIAEQGSRIVFVEVKFRRSGRSGSPREAVDARKRRHVLFAARGFLAEKGLEGRACRFDVIELSLERGGLTLVVEHLVAAFGCGR